jgi:hypothetical protein
MSETQEAFFVYAHILINALGFHRKLDVCLVDKLSADEFRIGAVVKKVTLEKKADDLYFHWNQSWTESGNPGEVNIQSRESSPDALIRFGDFIYNSDNGSLIYLVGEAEPLYKHKLDHHEAWKIKKQYERTRKLNYESPLEIVNNINWEIHIDGNAFQIVREFEDEGFCGFDLNPGFATFFAILKDGFQVSLDQDIESLISQRKNMRRTFDQKALKHSGFSFFAIYLYLNFKLFKEDLRGNPLSETHFKNYFLNEVGALLSVVVAEGLEPLPLDEICSKPVIDKIFKICDDLFEDFETGFLEENLFIPGRMVEVQQPKRPFLIFIYYYLLSLIEGHGTALFKRSKSKVDEAFLFASAKTLCFESKETLQKVLPQLSKYPVPGGKNFLATPLVQLSAYGFDLWVNGQKIETMSEAFTPEISLIDDGDWFALNPQIFFNAEEVDLAHFHMDFAKGLVIYKDKYYLLNPKTLPSWRRLQKFWEKLKGSKDKKALNTQKHLPLPKHEVLELLSLWASGVKVKGGAHWDRIVQFYKNLDKSADNFELPAKLQVELKHYQLQGVRWIRDLYELGLGGVLADEMGLGKTVQSLVFLEYLRQKDDFGNCLIVVPTSLTYNWYSEAQKFMPDLPILNFDPRDRDGATKFFEDNKGGVLIATYGLLVEHTEWFENQNWKVVYFDEAQNLKNISAQRTTAARKLKVKFKLCLTGTPMENHFGEFYSLIDLVLPGSLGDYSNYRQSFETKNVTLDSIADLKLKTKPLLLRRTKEHLLKDLPAKTEFVTKISFDEKQKKIYRDIATSYNEQVQSVIQTKGESKAQLEMLTALLRLRQVCSYPGAVPGVKYDDVPPKLSVLFDSLESILESGHSALIFTQFLPTLHCIHRELQAKGVKVYCIHGALNRQQREDVLKKFSENSDAAVLVMTLKTGGVGLNLTKASYVFHIEPWWNPAVENQATDRAHRLGQEKSVQVFRYIMQDSVEDKIEVLKKRKQGLFNQMFVDQSFNEVEGAAEVQLPSSSALSRSDFDFLLGLN